MKNFTRPFAFFCLCSLFLPTALRAQDCATPNATILINTPTNKIYLGSAGNLWVNPDGPTAGFTTTEAGDPNREVSLIFSGGVWIGAMDQGQNLKIAIATYGFASSSGQTDYFAGPLSEFGQTDATQCANFDRQWTVTQQDITALQNDLADGTLDNPIPSQLQQWPANGNPLFETAMGFPLPQSTQGLAPFIDLNGDGLYDPSLGDVPNIKGADQAVWWVFNDAGGIHTHSNGDPLQFEIHIMAYNYSSQPDPISNTTFYDYTFINRTLSVRDSFFASIWVDPDLGCYIDDYIGCDSTRNLAFVYNEDEFDGGEECNDCPQGVTDFCEEIPILGFKVLKGIEGNDGGQMVDRGMSSFYNYNESTPLPIGGFTPISLYNAMNGRCPDGQRMTRVGTGCDILGGNDYTNYLYHGSPSDPDAWTMCSLDSSLASDHRILINSGPGNIPPGGRATLSLAVFKAYGNNYPCPSLESLWAVDDEVTDFFNGLPTAIPTLSLENGAVEFFPNPMRDISTLRLKGEQSLQQVELFSLDGRRLRSYLEIQANEVQLEKGDLNSGMYLYRLQTTEGKWFSGKMIVQ